MGENEEVESGQPMIMTTSQETFSTNPILFFSENSEIIFENSSRTICKRLHSMKIKVKRKRKPRIGFELDLKLR